MSDQGSAARKMGGYTIIGPLAYRGKEGCRSVICTRHVDVTDRCYGWHCAYCDEACSSQGHRCDAANAILGESSRIHAEMAASVPRARVPEPAKEDE